MKLKDSNIIKVGHVTFNLVSSKVPKFCFRMWVKGDRWDKGGHQGQGGKTIDEGSSCEFSILESSKGPK